MEWRFLAHASDDEPGFSTAWLQQKSLKREADCREQEYRKGVLAGFANEFGMTSIFPTRRLEQGVDEDGAEGDDVEEEHDHVVGNKKSPSISSRTTPGGSMLHRDLPILPEVLLHWPDCHSQISQTHPRSHHSTLAAKTHKYRANVMKNGEALWVFKRTLYSLSLARVEPDSPATRLLLKN